MHQKSCNSIIFLEYPSQHQITGIFSIYKGNHYYAYFHRKDTNISVESLDPPGLIFFTAVHADRLPSFCHLRPVQRRCQQAELARWRPE